jgi:hypothetical protein
VSLVICEDNAMPEERLETPTRGLWTGDGERIWLIQIVSGDGSLEISDLIRRAQRQALGKVLR